METKENKKPCIGIDVSKGCSHFRCFLSGGEPYGGVHFINHDKEGFKEIVSCSEEIEKLKGHKPVIVFENTGTYSECLITFCEKNKFIYYCIPPLLSAKQRKECIRPTKTDAIDCTTIANVYYTKRIRASKASNPILIKLKKLCSYHLYNLSILRSLKVKYRELLDILYPRIDLLFDPYSDSCLELVSKYPNPYKLKTKSVKELFDFFSKIQYVGRAKAEKNALCIKEYFKHMVFTVEENDQFIDLFSIHTKKLIQHIKDCKLMEEQIINLGMHTELFKYILTIPGISKETASRIAAEIQDIDRFESKEKFVAYIGIDPMVHQSGKMNGLHLPIAKKGNTRLRSLLYLVVAGTSKSKALINPIRDFTNKKKSDGLAPKQAIIAGCNKLARIIFAVCSKREPFNYNQV